MCDLEKGDLVEDEDELSVSDDSEPEERPMLAPFDPDLDHSDDDDDDEEVRAPAGCSEKSQFSLKGGGSAFSHRTHSIFDCLDSLAKPSSSSSSSSSSQNQQTDSVFARPQAPPPSRKTSQPPLSPPNPPKKKWTPDYLLHPERWTHYSLEDVSETSDHGNARAALNFLSALKEGKQEEQSGGDSPVCDLQQRMIYNKPSRPRREEATVRSREKETRLSHLQEEGEEEGRETREDEGRRREAEEEHAEGRTDEEKQRLGEREQEEEKEESGAVFTSFRKMNSKNYRRSSGREED
ncbi:protein TSSC4 [Cheilinus undulatus]|uniref:protein TSSC4 n=1 Tax=Cheilinus undulatus TaxID=241271 RepID=UPI001BD6C650|nr:protein TSSC4 [Cheilinus undulatus]XP_041640787.1 protein TSSC4 [Cheilinus undulatus]